MRLHQRLAALENKDAKGLPHVVMWGAHQTFADALSASSPSAGLSPRLLIEIAFNGDAPLTPSQIDEQNKAYAWADELEAV